MALVAARPSAEMDSFDAAGGPPARQARKPDLLDPSLWKGNAMPRFSRRSFLAGAAGTLAWGALAPGIWPRMVRAQGFDPEHSAADLITDRTQAAIDSGLAYLVARQNEDGSFGSGGYSRNVAVVALGGMAFMASGSTPSRGPLGEPCERVVNFLLNHTQDDGFIILPESASHGPMYGHGFATLFLAEAYGMTMRPDIREKLKKAVRLIIDTQNDEGGWRYQPQPREADISVTICQIMALRAARNAGIYVPKTTVDACIDYVKRSQNPDGGFMYLPTGGPSLFPRSAAGVVALYSAGYDGPEIKKGLEYLIKERPRGRFNRHGHYFYGHYYAVQAMWHAGGEYWTKWYPAIRDELLSLQRDDGSWTDDAICPEYATGMACIILQMPNNYLPILQR